MIDLRGVRRTLLEPGVSGDRRLDGRTLSLDIVTEYRIPYKKETGSQEFHTSLTLRENP